MTDRDDQPTIREMDPRLRESANSDLGAKFALITRRCADSGVKVEEKALLDGLKCLIVSIPNGRNTRTVTLSSPRDADRLLDTQFEHYVALGDYQAICSYADGMIETAIRPLDVRGGMPTGFLWRRLFDYDPYSSRPGREELKPIELVSPGTASDAKITIGSMSRELQVLGDRRVPRQTAPSLRISGLRVTQHDAAVEVLEKLSNTVLFELDLKMNIALGLVRDRGRLARTRRPTPDGQARELNFPSCEYPQQPMSLYWYARSATGMPLLQYLAYYQSLEFFFPIYSQTEAHRRVRNILKDPSFSPHRDTDINRLLSAIGPAYGRGFGGELSQLRATLQECIDPDELRRFLSEVPERADFCAKSKVVTEKRLPLANPAADLRNDVADRIYELRCKIVHTKAADSDMGVDLLLPFSREAESLDHDIDLIQFIARRVLIASSGPLHV